jgi:hypothetical protein
MGHSSQPLLIGAMIATASILAAAGPCGDPRSPTASDWRNYQCEPLEYSLPTAFPTEEWTAEWLSGYSDRLTNYEAEQRRRLVSRLVADEVLLNDVSRHETTAMFRRQYDLEQALAHADALIVGVAGDQYLRRGIHPEFGLELNYLVSDFALDDGGHIRVGQSVGI